MIALGRAMVVDLPRVVLLPGYPGTGSPHETCFWERPIGRETMPMNRREFIAATVAEAAMLRPEMKAFADPTGNIQLTIDASKSGTPINPMIFGDYIEP